MMYAELYQYLISHNKLAVPGIGTFLVDRKPAENDFVSKRINPPVYSLSLHPVANTPPTNFFSWLANTLNISDQDAVFRFDNFIVDVKQQISNGGVIEWNDVGVLSKSLSGEIKFKPAEPKLGLQKPVVAEKIIRQNAEHMVRVGEDNKTSAQMVEMLKPHDEKKSFWWAYALSLALLAFVFLGWYFSKHGLDTSSTANKATATPLEAGSSYILIP